MEDIIAQLMYTLQECRAVPEEARNQFRKKKAEDREPIGTCPVCGQPVFEGTKVFFCSNTECSFCLWKDNRFLAGMRKKLTKEMAVDLLTDGRTFVEGLYSRKKNKTFSADLVMEIKDGKPAFALEFPKRRNRDE